MQVLACAADELETHSVARTSEARLNRSIFFSRSAYLTGSFLNASETAQSEDR
jgi:hypothetical protein